MPPTFPCFVPLYKQSPVRFYQVEKGALLDTVESLPATVTKAGNEQTPCFLPSLIRSFASAF